MQAAFRDSHECVAVELRGYGLSSRPEVGWAGMAGLPGSCSRICTKG